MVRGVEYMLIVYKSAVLFCDLIFKKQKDMQKNKNKYRQFRALTPFLIEIALTSSSRLLKERYDISYNIEGH